MREIVMTFIAVFIFAACNSSKRTTAPGDKTDELYALMQGSYSSAAQAEADSTYYNISLHMYPIWEGANNGKWLYVEQALFEAQDRPYRQRVYELRKEGGFYKSYVYTLPKEENYIGAWKTPELFNLIGPDDLEMRDGCEVVMSRLGKDKFKGSTGEKTCSSELRGASYASSTVEIDGDVITSWDQGWNSAGEQVWGATEGGYVFVKY